MPNWCDFSKAFDTVDHAILLTKLRKYGIQGVELQWFNDNLFNMLQYVFYIRSPIVSVIYQ